MGCSQSKAPATPAARTARVESARESLDGRSWAAHASYELPPEDRRAGPPPSRPSAVAVCEHFRDAPTPTPAFGLGLPARDTPSGDTPRLEFEDRGVVHADRAAALWRCPALLDAPPGSRVSSPWFTLPTPSASASPSSSPILPVGSRPSERARSRPSRSSPGPELDALDWRLFWEVQDFSPDSCSLYLECRPAPRDRDLDVAPRARRRARAPEPWAVNVCFSFAVVRGDVERYERPARARRVDPDRNVEVRPGANRERPKADASDDDADDTDAVSASADRPAHVGPVAGLWYASIRDTLGFGGGAARCADVETAAAAAEKSFAACSCGDEACDVARRLRRAGRGMEIAMAHTFTGSFDDEQTRPRPSTQTQTQTRTQPRTQWGAQEYLTYEDVRFALSDSRRPDARRDGRGGDGDDLLVEVMFHSVGDVEDEEEASDGVSRPVGAGRRGSRRDSGPGLESSAGDGEAREHRLRPAPPAWPAARAPSLGDLTASPLGAPEASVQLLSESPLLLVFDNFLAAGECAELMSIAEPDLRRSRVTDGKLSDGRTSSSTFLTGAKQDEPIVRVVERRVLRAAKSAGRIAARRAEERGRAGGHECALSGAEPMQVVKYDEGQMYTAHYDNKQGCVRRAATFMMYLSDVDAGGATYFPKAVPLTVRDPTGARADAGARQGGVRIWPKRGRAVCFWSVRAGTEDPRSLHEAEPIVAGEKWIATKWLQVEEEDEEDDAGNAAADAARDAETR